MTKVKAAIIGSGKMGTDLMVKLQRSDSLELTTVIEADADSDGVMKAKEFGCEVVIGGIEEFLKKPERADIIFDASTAKAHLYHAERLQGYGKKVVNLTPADAGTLVVPSVNAGSSMGADHISLLSCQGQATIPLIHAVSSVADVKYAEMISSVSSLSVGRGTRANIDEITEITKKGIEQIGGAETGKAIILFNAAVPAVPMNNTVHIYFDETKNNQDEIASSILSSVQQFQKNMPGYRMKQNPIFMDNKVTIFTEVEGTGYHLPGHYSGGQELMAAAAVHVAEEMTKGTTGR